MASSISPLLILLICIRTIFQVNSSGVLHLEDGYKVTTILDGNKFSLNPRSVLPQFGSSDLIILDSSSSTFYTLSFATPQDTVVKKLAGNGESGYADGELGSAMFNKPKNFAVDYKGNLYVVDKFNHTIRKISKSGVTTIAGGYSQKIGKEDGPAQYASFSDDVELVFIPEMCALIISDHGNKLVRQINLKAEDCLHGSQSVMGQASAWALGLGLSCLLGIIIGFVLRPYVMSRTGRTDAPVLQQDMDTLPNQLGETTTDALLRYEKRSYCLQLRNNHKAKSRVDQLEDLISFDEEMVSSVGAEENIEHKDDEDGETDGSAVCNSKVDTLIEANITGFAAQANEILVAERLERNTCLVRRR